MTNREDIVLEARSWIGTPYVHQASCKGGGTDCLGLIRGIWRTVIGSEPLIIPSYSSTWSNSNEGNTLLEAASTWLKQKPISSSDLGDVLLFRLGENGPGRHLGISAENRECATFIHAYSTHRVLETSLSVPWKRRIMARFEFPIGEK